ncbi:MAG: hypothetical protein ACRD3W_05600 [Terriglobales bacterium]
MSGTITPDPIATCMAAQSMQPQPEKKKKGPIRFVAKALASEMGSDLGDMVKDSAFVFSNRDFDPWQEGPKKGKPYTALELQLVDGESAQVIRYPDDSAKVVGSYLDGTIIAPSGQQNTYIMAYPNGARARLVKVSSMEYKIYRPDNTVTTMKKEMSGEWQLDNSKIGYMGTAQPDREGMQYEFKSKDF